MGKKKTNEEYIKELAIKNPDVQAVEEYIDINTPILHHCFIHDVYWKPRPASVLKGSGCEECRIEKFRKVKCKTHEQYVKEVAEINPDILVVDNYIDARTPIKHYCKKHKIHWMSSPDNILHGCGCHECGNEKIGNKNRKTHEEYVKEVAEINPDVEVAEQYIDALTPILHRCKIDGYEWTPTPANILYGKGCPKCNDSYGEKLISKWLDAHNINYIQQKTFIECKNIKQLPFDFYLPDYNACIEYDGEQHFNPIVFFGGEEGFQKRKCNDEIKTKYCENNNVHLLRISYFQDITESLESFLFI